MHEDSNWITQSIQGQVANSGYAQGYALWHNQPKIPEHSFDTYHENLRLEQGFKKIHEDLLDWYQKSKDQPTKDIINAYTYLINDPLWQRDLRNLINSGYSAEGAILSWYQKQGRVWQQYISDLQSLSNQLLKHIQGSKHLMLENDQEYIIIAETIGPAELLEYQDYPIKGLLTSDSASSHTKIIVKSMEIVLIDQLGLQLKQIVPGQKLALDGIKGIVYLKPTSDWNLSLAQPIDNVSTITKDERQIKVALNSSLLSDLRHLNQVQNVGLFRTEIEFLAKPDLLQQQVGFYQKVLDYAQEKPIYFRTLDIGRDKVTRKLKIPNNFLQKQIRALLQAHAGKPMWVMFPMIGNIQRFWQMRDLLYRECKMMDYPPSELKVGVMLEIPNLAFELSKNLDSIDFIALGSNDLWNLFGTYDTDILNPGFLRFLQFIVQNVDNVPLSVCGTMASYPLSALALLGLGITNLSVEGEHLQTIFRMICSVKLWEVQEYLQVLLGSGTQSIRSKLKYFARDHGIAI